MLEQIDLTRKVSKEDFKATHVELERRLAALQRESKERGIPVIIAFEGWNAAGKGTLINRLIMPLDPRGFTVESFRPPTEEEQRFPFLWRFWVNTPANGRWTICDRTWYRPVLQDRVTGLTRGRDIERAFRDINAFERQLADGGTVIVKFFLHISMKEQKKRFDQLRKNPATAWRVTKHDLKRHKQYDDYFSAYDEMLARTDSEFAPWTVVESHDERFAILKILDAMISALERRLAAPDSNPGENRSIGSTPERDLPGELKESILDRIDLSQHVEPDDYKQQLGKKQDRVRELEYEIYQERIPVIIVYEGWDAAGKGGNIRRITQNLDPRGYEVVPIAAPNDIEKAHHYLWRFWMQLPKSGHITIFDRSWYGRVMVERVEGFCSETEWRRAYREINEMEEHITDFGTVMLKFWIHIDREEQLRRFESRKEMPHKQWKITEEDWRNREKWDAHREAVEEMIYRTSTPYAPWTIIESNSKRFARLKALDTVIEAIEHRLA